jgi:selenide,water dikinase
MWGMNPLAGVRLTLINPGPVAAYSGMLPGFVAGHYPREKIMIDLTPLAAFAGARLILDTVTRIDPVKGRVHLAGREPVEFDVASVNVGITSDLPDLPGFVEFGSSAKPLGDFAAAWQAFLAQGLAAPRITVIGGSVAGVELALAVAHRLAASGARAEVTLLERGNRILPLLGPRAARILQAALHRAGVKILTGVHPVGLAAGQVRLSNAQMLASDFTLSAAGARPPDWLADCGLAMTDGFLAVGPTLQTSDQRIFAAGDCAHLTASPRPKAGVFAVREAPVLFANLRAALSGQGRMRAYAPQRDYLKLISMGRKAAVAEKLGVALQGRGLWIWKDWIDRKFMKRLADLPPMPQPPLPAHSARGLAAAIGLKPACGGCGAKVGQGALRAVVSALPPTLRPDILSGPGDDAAVLQMGDGVQVITTDHLRAVTEDAYLMAQIAAVHALGDIWAMGARPQGALAQIILPGLSAELQARTLIEIMAAAGTVFRACGADIVGGHTSVGAELTIGFAVTGLARDVTPKGGARPGDALILTKPLGSGTVLAAGMAGIQLPGLLLGEVQAATHASMIRPMGQDADLLRPVAHAMTDVTGFGLAGHLLEMLHASHCAATISLGSLPLLPGAEALANAGIASTLAPDNRAACGPDMTFIESPRTESARAALLFDPQTCGGLLAAVPANQAAPLLAAFHAQGIIAANIGQVTAGQPHLLVRD